MKEQSIKCCQILGSLAGSYEESNLPVSANARVVSALLR